MQPFLIDLAPCSIYLALTPLNSATSTKTIRRFLLFLVRSADDLYASTSPAVSGFLLRAAASLPSCDDAFCSGC